MFFNECGGEYALIKEESLRDTIKTNREGKELSDPLNTNLGVLYLVSGNQT